MVQFQEIKLKKLSIALHGNDLISFDNIEIISRKNKKILHIKEIKNIKKILKKKILFDIKQISKKKKFKNLKFSNLPILMGVLNLTPNSFSDGGKYIKKFRRTTCKKIN